MSETKKSPEDILAELSSEDAEKLLSAPPEDNPELKEFSAVYQRARQEFSKGNHPDVMELAEYIIAESAGEDFRARGLFTGIQKHLEVCPLCKAEYHSLLEDLPQQVHQEKTPTVPVRRGKKNKLSFSKIVYYPVRIAAVFLLGWLAVYSASELSMPETIRYGSADITPDGVSRALTSDTFSETHTLVSEERYDEAISLLLRQIEEEPDGASAFYLHYTAGKLYLLSAQSDLFGMFTSYDDEKVSLAQKEFQLAIEKNYSGKYENISYDASFYLAKTYILQNNFSKGKELLEYVAGTRGSKSREAAELLSEF
ncbi:MAG: hypothetical protein L6Q47_13845 [Ignavibacteriaceae bacterium]|nr:hypothetical protein [Ignavibacteriaceae bacterium]